MWATAIPSTSYVISISFQKQKGIGTAKNTSNRLPNIKLLIIPLIVITGSIMNPRMMASRLIVNTLRCMRRID